MDQEAIMLSEISQIETDKYHRISFYVESNKTKQTHRYTEQTGGYQRVRARGG